jgi:hypothetical protein
VHAQSESIVVVVGSRYEVSEKPSKLLPEFCSLHHADCDSLMARHAKIFNLMMRERKHCRRECFGVIKGSFFDLLAARMATARVFAFLSTFPRGDV